VSTINLDSPGEVKRFLRILAEESVAQARSTLEGDPKQASFEAMLSSDEQVYGSLDEQEDEEAPEEVDAEEVDAEEVEEPMTEPERLEVSLDSISRAVKDLRSGRSVDDSSMKEQLRTYFDRLEPTERQALLAFMKSFAGILTGQLQGAEAPDPSDDPYNISMTSGDDEEEVPEEPVAGEEVEEEEVEEEEVEKEPAEQPPIKAGISEQNLTEIRNKVRALMNL